MDIIEQKTRDNIEFFAGYWTVLDVCKRGLGGGRLPKSEIAL